MVEFALGHYYLPGMTGRFWVPGVAMLFAGEVLRKVAVITAGRSFTHLIKVRRREHAGRLVTGGIYALVRHPGYLGFFVFALGSQVMLGNPLSLCAFYYVLSRFFADRIEFEEAALVHIFGEKYSRYAEGVWSGIPFVP